MPVPDMDVSVALVNVGGGMSPLAPGVWPLGSGSRWIAFPLVPVTMFLLMVMLRTLDSISPMPPVPTLRKTFDSTR